jgi:carbonic anhydrase/acetyltransferase-like protein (isoleucine patch superfamily)
VEASVLGNNVSVGAGALIRGSYVGDGARISEGAKVLGSVVGDGSEVTWNSILNLSLLYPRACVGIPGLQTVFVGRETFVSSMAFVIDVKFQGGYIGVRHQGKTVNTRLTTLGPCLGHRVRIGAGVTINCGREIPNDTAIIQDQDPLLSKLPEPTARPGIYTVKKGTLSPVGGLPAAPPVPDREKAPA